MSSFDCGLLQFLFHRRLLPNHTQLQKWISTFVNSSSTHGRKVIPATSLQKRARASCISVMLHVGIHLAVNDCHCHGAKNELPERADPLPIIFFCLPWSALRSQHKKLRIALSLLPRSLENHRNHLHPSLTHHLPKAVWASTTRAVPDKVRTTPAKCHRNSNNHGPIGSCVCLGRDTQTPAR